MVVKRIVVDIAAQNTRDGAIFYEELLGLRVAMDLDWAVTYVSDETMPVQLSVVSEGGSGAAIPDISIEVDDVDEVFARAQTLDLEIVYDLVTEPWGVRRFFVKDPFGKTVNILSHS